MLYALNNQKLLVRDIENFSKENFNAANNTDNRVVAILKRIAKTLAKFVIVNMQLNNALNILHAAIAKDCECFSRVNDREKEDILIKWEGLARTLNGHSRNLPGTASSFLTKGVVRKSNTIIDTVNNFINDLKSELYPNINEPLSQEYLKELSKKFAHLPKEMLDDLIYDEQTETV